MLPEENRCSQNPEKKMQYLPRRELRKYVIPLRDYDRFSITKYRSLTFYRRASSDDYAQLTHKVDIGPYITLHIVGMVGTV